MEFKYSDLTLTGYTKYSRTSCTINTKQTMDDGTWIREDTLTMQLAIPPDLCIYNKHIHRYEMVQSNRCNWMITDE